MKFSKTIRESREENIFTTASVGGVPLSAQDTEAAEESPSDVSVHESKKKDNTMTYPFTQTRLDENRVIRYFSKSLTEGELAGLS